MQAPPCQLEGLESQWTPHFSQLEAGIRSTIPELLRKCVHRQTCSLFDAPRNLHFADFPSVLALEDAFRHTASGKATGEDPLPSGLFHTAACPVAEWYHDLLMKEFV